MKTFAKEWFATFNPKRRGGFSRAAIGYAFNLLAKPAPTDIHHHPLIWYDSSFHRNSLTPLP